MVLLQVVPVLESTLSSVLREHLPSQLNCPCGLGMSEQMILSQGSREPRRDTSSVLCRPSFALFTALLSRAIHKRGVSFESRFMRLPGLHLAVTLRTLSGDSCFEKRLSRLL